MSIRKILAKNMKRLYQRDLITCRDGNISFKPKNANYFLITAGSVLKSQMTKEQIIKVHFDQEHTWIKDDSIYKPSRELNLHYYIQRQTRNKEENTFVVHSHPPNAIAYMGVKEHENQQLGSIQKYFPEMNVGTIGKNVPFFDAGTNELANSCSMNLYTPYTMVGMRQHGTLCVGNDIDQIIEHIETLEYYIQIYLRSRCIHVYKKLI